MALLEWSDELSVGIDIIDKQHMILVRTINLLTKALEKNIEHELLPAIFETLADYTASNFSYEEHLFENFGYPETQQHKQSHQALLQRLTELRMEFEAGANNLGPELLKFLVEWLTKHVMGTDKQYVPFLHAAMAAQRNKMS